MGGGNTLAYTISGQSIMSDLYCYTTVILHTILYAIYRVEYFSRI